MFGNLQKNDRLLMIFFIIMVLAGPIILAPFGAGYPDLLQRFAIFGIFAIGFNILFGLKAISHSGMLPFWVWALIPPYGCLNC